MILYNYGFSQTEAQRVCGWKRLDIRPLAKLKTKTWYN